MAQARTSQRFQEAWAGIGWVKDVETGKGLLVEHEGHYEEEVRENINKSLGTLAVNREMEFGQINMSVSGIKCMSESVCALVVAVFEPEGWNS
jgi:arginine decarboxylase